jgi:hypothetical protein
MTEEDGIVSQMTLPRSMPDQKRPTVASEQSTGTAEHLFLTPGIFSQTDPEHDENLA